jgi:hypothetical protein
MDAARVMAASVHDLRSAISRTRHQKDFGEGPAIENVHYFGFVLPIYFLRSLAGWRAGRRRTAILPPMWWVRLAEVGGIARPPPVHATRDVLWECGSIENVHYFGFVLPDLLSG